MTEETVSIIVFGLVAALAIGCLTFYAVIRVCVTGEPIFKRHALDESDSNVVGMGKRR